MNRNKKTELWALGIVILAGVFYLLSMNAYFVGFFNDDAYYIIGAKSLSSGAYSRINQLNNPPLTNYFPGYPVLLAPLLAAGNAVMPGAAQKYLILRLFSIILITGSIFLVYGIFREFFSSEYTIIAVILLFSLNPITVSLSGTVLSDIPYTFFSLLCIYLLVKNKNFIVTSCLLGFLASIRPVGIILFVAAVTWLLVKKQNKNAVILFLVGGLITSIYPVRNLIIGAGPTHYITQLLSSYVSGMAAGIPERNFIFYSKEIIGRTFFRLPASPGAEIISWLIILGFLLVSLLGMIKSWEKLLPVNLYLVGYTVFHLFWPLQCQRYFLPVLPIMLFLFFYGLEALLPARLKPWVISAVYVFSIFLCVKVDRQIIEVSHSRGDLRNTPKINTYNWVTEKLPEKSVIACQLDGTTYLYTHRYTVAFPVIGSSADEFYNDLKQNCAGYVLFQPDLPVLTSPGGNNPGDPFPVDVLAKLLSDKAKYRLLYASPAEKTAVFGII